MNDVSVIVIGCVGDRHRTNREGQRVCRSLRPPVLVGEDDSIEGPDYLQNVFDSEPG